MFTPQEAHVAEEVASQGQFTGITGKREKVHRHLE